MTDDASETEGEPMRHRAPRETGRTRESKRQLWGALATLATAMAVAVPALVNSCSAQDRTDKTEDKLSASYSALRRTAQEQYELLSHNAQELLALHQLSGVLTEVARKCLTPEQFRDLGLPGFRFRPPAPIRNEPAELPATPEAAAAAQKETP